MKTGTLYLIPTPIDEQSLLNPEAHELLLKKTTIEADSSIIVVEDLKPARRRWIAFGLPREAIDKFVQLNEHNFAESTKKLIGELQSGKDVLIMSDGGLPAFCDPGKDLVYEAHKNKIKVTATPFFNSVILALALSGFKHSQFFFQGFLPLDSDQRKMVIESFVLAKHTTIVMDTPYRLKRLLEELDQLGPRFKKEIFLALDLNAPSEELHLGSPRSLLNKIADFKREFILIVSA